MTSEQSVSMRPYCVAPSSLFMSETLGLRVVSLETEPSRRFLCRTGLVSGATNCGTGTNNPTVAVQVCLCSYVPDRTEAVATNEFVALASVHAVSHETAS